ncbi:MAG TPA: RNA 2',3'-cyclic phosphodiesterase, partial [Candidatus Methanomethylicus sp.]|nr:RNA 2',3'-cyclic phosphodiesterase [Candidatus Methanomethylicus sp.]
METVRAFLALEVSREVKRKIMELQNEIAGSGADVKLVGEENMHVTLKFLGDIDETTVGKVANAMGAVRSEAFLLEVAGAGAFPNA